MTVVTAPSLAVVMPCYDTRPEQLHIALDSALRETTAVNAQGVQAEIVLVDDCGPSPNTRRAIDALARTHPGVRVERLPRNGGSSAARNHGVRVTKGRWLAFLDCDDQWLPGALQRLLAASAIDESIDWVSGSFCYQLDGQPPSTRDFYLDHPARLRHVQLAYDEGRALVMQKPVEAFMDGSLASMGSCLIDRGLFERVGGFDERLRMGDDTELYWRLAREATFAFLPEPVFAYRRSPNSLSGSQKVFREWEPPVIRRMLRSAGWQPHAAALTRRLAGALEQNVYGFRKLGQRRGAMRAAAELLALQPLSAQRWRLLLGAAFDRSPRAAV